jgi:hypothetical protein
MVNFFQKFGRKFIAPTGISTLKKKGDKKVQSKAASGEKVPGEGPRSKPLTISELTSIPFELELGDAATVPPVGVDPSNPDTLKPYAPLILRHPKTNRILGYPNAVMVYTRPYEPTADQHAHASGVKTKVNPRVTKEARDKIAKRASEELNKAVSVFTDKALKVKEKYSQNRFSYGLNSAGVYVYAYDQSRAITQFTLLPAKNVEVTKGGQATKDLKFDRSTMVRPISDERGFEVVGHFPYGRGSYLRDGSLVLTEGGNNQKAQVSTPLAVGGPLSSILAAQSQGLVTPGPIDVAMAINDLLPEDLQTAGAINPNTKEPEFVSTGTNFVSTAPLGSMEHKGVPPSLEASQLSRALTLAELTVKIENGTVVDTNCQCMVGRQDLGFVNQGYQVKTIRDAAPASDIVDMTKPLSNTVKGQDLQNKIESYLWSVYQSATPDHVKYEDSLRGSSGGTEPTPGTFTFDNVAQDRGDFSPPFSALGRSAMGDPNAIALQAESNSETLGNSFKKFSEDLQKEPRKAELTERIANLRRVIALKEQERDRTPSDSPLLPQLDQEIAALQQQLGNLQLELQTL